MKTIVVQSFRTYDVPPWIQSCMATVSSWAQRSGFSYRLSGDELLLLVPEWYRIKASKHIAIITDLARLMFMRQCLMEGFERAIWADADIVIFEPTSFLINPCLSFAYCREVWVTRDPSGILTPDWRINNAVCMFRRDGIAHLERHLRACLSIVRQLPRMRDNLEVGTRFLTALDRGNPLSLVDGVGLANPVIVKAILDDDSDALAQFVKWHGGPIYALNLCNTFRGQTKAGIKLSDNLYSTVIEKLMVTAGKQLSQCARDGNRGTA